MKKYQTNDSSINENKAEMSLLNNMLDFYISKYASFSIEETEKHFLNALGSLVDRGEIDEKTVKEFLDEKGIEGEIPKMKPKIQRVETYNDGGCGYTRPTYRGC